jgi:serine/threonine protein phosphatase 1
MRARLKRLLQCPPNEQAIKGLPDKHRVYAVGDIHGCLDLLQDVHQKISQHALAYQGTKIVVYLGDYVDRGPHSMQVVDYLLAQTLSNFKAVYLLGNHEQVLLQFIEGHGLEIAHDWFGFGGLATLQSYGVTLRGIPTLKDLPRLQAEFAEKCPVAHRQFYQALALSFELGGYFFVHAGIKPKLPLTKQIADDMLWIRDEFLNSRKQFEKVIVHGHSVSVKPEIKSNRIGLDTGAYATGLLTCAVFEGERVDIL